MPDNPNRQLVKTFPGLPEGAGIYDDGQFYNCAPGQPAQAIPYDDEMFYHADPETGDIVIDPEGPGYQSVRGGFALAGVDMQSIHTIEEMEDAIYKYIHFI